MTETLEATPAAVRVDAANWFEIATTDLERATQFYEMLLGTQLQREYYGEPMTLLPASRTGVGGALIHRLFQRPSKCGTLVYLNCDTGIDAALERMQNYGVGLVTTAKAQVPGGFGFYACIRDSEGNHIGLHEH